MSRILKHVCASVYSYQTTSPPVSHSRLFSLLHCSPQPDSLINHQDLSILPPEYLPNPYLSTSLATTLIQATVIFCLNIGTYLSASTFAHLQSILHASTTVIFLKHKSDHITTLLKHFNDVQLFKRTYKVLHELVLLTLSFTVTFTSSWPPFQPL